MDRSAIRPPSSAHAAGDGMSLLELVVAMMLLSFLALAITPMLMMGALTSSAAQDATELSVAASDRLEYLAALPFDDPALAAGGGVATSVTGYSEDPHGGDADRYVRWEVADESAILKRIILVAGERNSVVGPTREVRVETFRADLR
ncbi:MAG: prepilin-type N-terminal cleavage/methylation domain-containing protein [Acidobacteria bacterium]|nr:prepilin-type N-terminal cleavage/methylation domain-containing protein [Acidobacteriota bacterium]